MSIVRGTPKIESDILNAVYGAPEPELVKSIAERGLEALPVLAEHLSKDLRMDVLERFEHIFKQVLCAKFTGAVSGEAARQIASFQKSVGFLLKYKSYTIKAASPLGYSVFTQNRGEGFSFQRHVSHKTEVFHILEVKPGGFVFICDYEDWAEVYDRERFAAWLAGAPDSGYDRFRFEPSPGDVFVIDELGVVHTVIGCVLEEYATVSTDMVDRLHDQNAGKGIPSHFNRGYFQETMRRVCMPGKSRLVDLRSSERRVSEIAPVDIKGGRMLKLARTAVIASRYMIEPSRSSELMRDERCAASIHVTGGSGRIILGEREEVRRISPPSIEVSAGDLIMIPAGVYYAFASEGGDEMTLSEHRIPFEVAFV